MRSTTATASRASSGHGTRWNSAPCSRCCLRSQVASQIHAAGNSWTSDSRQFRTSSFTPRRRSTKVPAAHATGASHQRDPPMARVADSTVAASRSTTDRTSAVNRCQTGAGRGSSSDSCVRGPTARLSCRGASRAAARGRWRVRRRRRSVSTGSRTTSSAGGQWGASASADSRAASAHAACRAAPRATYSAGAGTRIGAPKRSGAIRCTASERAAPPISSTRRVSSPWATSASTPSARPQSIPSTAARARLAGVALSRVRPPTVPVAVGRSGVRSPSR